MWKESLIGSVQIKCAPTTAIDRTLPQNIMPIVSMSIVTMNVRVLAIAKATVL